MTEMDILRSIRLALSELGYCVFRINSGKVKMADGRWFDVGVPKGFSDLVAIKDGNISFIEVKAEHGRPTTEQINFINTMKNRYGCRAGIARSVNEAIAIVKGDNDGN